jgi:hypothetical protein
VSPSRSPTHRSVSTWAMILRRYGVAILSVAAIALLMQVTAPAWDMRPAFMVAVAVSTLYGGIGPGVLAVLLAGFVTMDPGIALGGAALVAVCTIFRRPPDVPEKTTQVPAEAAPTDRPSFESPGGGSIAFSSETHHTPPPFIEVTTEATWRFHHETPLDITLTEDEQVEHLYLYSVLAECNDAFARMYGFRTGADVIGTRLVVFCPPSNPDNLAYLRAFIRSGYRLEDAESQEIDRYGNAKYFVNNLVGIFERGQLVGAWGTQRDVTDQRRDLQPQEYRSRAHSAKSSSQ